ncbi:MAG: hypothetical protein RLY71_2373 [Pseudomonadota bacterium]|jgi:hypothetical protein
MSENPTSPVTPSELTPADCARKLGELFPALFGGAPKPLKLRIQADIQQRAPGVFTKQVLSAFLRRYTGGTAYLLALTRTKQRFDLDGQPAGELSEEHLEAARTELNRRRELNQARREQEDQQRRNRLALLHDFERTTLTRANFCALKGVDPDELDGLLEIARREASEAPPAPQRREPPVRRGPPGPDRGGRRPGPPRGPDERRR